MPLETLGSREHGLIWEQGKPRKMAKVSRDQPKIDKWSMEEEKISKGSREQRKMKKEQ